MYKEEEEEKKVACKSGGINLETQIRHLHLLASLLRPSGEINHTFARPRHRGKYTRRSLSPGISQNQNGIS